MHEACARWMIEGWPEMIELLVTDPRAVALYFTRDFAIRKERRDGRTFVFVKPAPQKKVEVIAIV